MTGTNKEGLHAQVVVAHHHHVCRGCLVAYALYSTQLTALHHSGSSGKSTLGAAQATRVGMAALQFKPVKLEGPPPPTGGAWSTHKRELVHPTSTASSWVGRGCFSGTTD